MCVALSIIINNLSCSFGRFFKVMLGINLINANLKVTNHGVLVH